MSGPTKIDVVVPARRLHPIYLLITTATTVRQALPYFVVTLVGGAPLWVYLVLFALIMIIAVAQWWVRKYSVANGILHLESGLLNRTARLVPVTRITALNAYRSLAQRLVGVWGLKIQTPGDHGRAVVSLSSLSTRRVDELVVALEGDNPAVESDVAVGTPASAPMSRTRRLRKGFARGSLASTDPAVEPVKIAALDTRGMLVAAVTGNLIPLIFALAVVVWFRFSDYLPPRTKDFVEDTIEPLGWVGVLVAFVVVAVAAGLLISALRLYKFTLVRDGDVLRSVRGLLSKQSGSFPVERIQAVRIVEGAVRSLFGLCSVQVEVAGVGRTNTNERTLFPLMRTADAPAMVRRALPELAWPTAAPDPLPRRLHRRYLTVPGWYGLGFTVLALALPGWWRLLALIPIPAAIWLGVARGRDAAWRLDATALTMRWRRILVRNTVVARRRPVQIVEWNSSPWKARAGVAGLRIRFSSGRSAKIRYMPAPDALLLLHSVGR